MLSTKIKEGSGASANYVIRCAKNPRGGGKLNPRGGKRNPAADTDTHPLPKIEHLFASLSGAKSSSKLYLAHA